jgi:hypothetical protein
VTGGKLQVLLGEIVAFVGILEVMEECSGGYPAKGHTAG